MVVVLKGYTELCYLPHIDGSTSSFVTTQESFGSRHLVTYRWLHRLQIWALSQGRTPLWLSLLVGRDVSMAESLSRGGRHYGWALYQGGTPLLLSRLALMDVLWLSPLAGRSVPMTKPSSLEGRLCCWAFQQGGKPKWLSPLAFRDAPIVDPSSM